MAVLSDKTIKEMMARNELITNGNADNAEHCSYEFTAALMLRGGSCRFEPIDKLGTEIKPAELVWIKAREEISVPANMVGLWIQTQRLARQGLLLLNISIIEPGYKGPLSAVLVNFGKQKVPIRPDTKIAKVVFLSLDTDATVGKWDIKAYDDEIVKMAANAPTSFLQLESFLPNIKEETKARLMAMDKEIELSVGNITNDAKFKLESELKEKMSKSFIKGYIGLAGGFLTGCAAVWIIISTFMPRLVAEYSGIEELARKASIAQQAETTAGLSTQLKTQASEIESLKKQIDKLETGKNKLQSQSGTSDTTPPPDGNNAVRNR
jgi:dUTPase/uncharacterized coiled-coil protein SlyX